MQFIHPENIVSDEKSTVVAAASAGASLMYFFSHPFYGEIGADYFQTINTKTVGFLTPFIGVGAQF
jgi:hypothetical protein